MTTRSTYSFIIKSSKINNSYIGNHDLIIHLTTLTTIKLNYLTSLYEYSFFTSRKPKTFQNVSFRRHFSNRNTNYASFPRAAKLITQIPRYAPALTHYHSSHHSVVPFILILHHIHYSNTAVKINPMKEKKKSSSYRSKMRSKLRSTPAPAAASSIYWDSVDSSGSGGSSGTGSRNYVDPWDLENYAYLRRHSVAAAATTTTQPIYGTHSRSVYGTSRMSRHSPVEPDYWSV